MDAVARCTSQKVTTTTYVIIIIIVIHGPLKLERWEWGKILRAE